MSAPNSPTRSHPRVLRPASVDYVELAKLMRSAIVMLGFAVDDLERGLWTPDECDHLADGLEKLVAALRSGDGGRTVIDVGRGE
ncbi:hypothetical protein GCM10011581_25940 [Saccharopolyspora subtropica]|uniref:Uncharacterized protein n=1 Tax=Saccharopolyspora thermophila TaxID=89367 RepID=A0A917JWQ7_9PSEU|nr:hypothetical protein [Saccharopolyspora subtropica]GGI87695.1 hypothetical protein GCM10011581_25940 [Saccharopolyspora subtropica]